MPISATPPTATTTVIGQENEEGLPSIPDSFSEIYWKTRKPGWSPGKDPGGKDTGNGGTRKAGQGRKGGIGAKIASKAP